MAHPGDTLRHRTTPTLQQLQFRTSANIQASSTSRRTRRARYSWLGPEEDVEVTWPSQCRPCSPCPLHASPAKLGGRMLCLVSRVDEGWREPRHRFPCVDGAAVAGGVGESGRPERGRVPSSSSPLFAASSVAAAAAASSAVAATCGKIAISSGGACCCLHLCHGASLMLKRIWLLLEGRRLVGNNGLWLLLEMLTDSLWLLLLRMRLLLRLLCCPAHGFHVETFPALCSRG